jgi:hypothetical protein
MLPNTYFFVSVFKVLFRNINNVLLYASEKEQQRGHI